MGNGQIDITSVTSIGNFGELAHGQALFEAEIQIRLKSSNLHSDSSITQMNKINRFLKKVSHLSRLSLSESKASLQLENRHYWFPV